MYVGVERDIGEKHFLVITCNTLKEDIIAAFLACESLDF